MATPSDLDLRKVRVLRELDQRGTVSAVAEALHLTPSAVSQQLTALARETGVRLLEPAGRRVRLTGAARILLQHADRLFAQLEAVHADLAAFQEGDTAEVRVTSFGSAITGIILPALRDLRERRPGLSLVLRESELPDGYTGLVHGEMDIAVVIAGPDVPTSDDARYVRVPLLSDTMDVMLPAGHPLASRRDIALAELVDETWVTGSVGACSQLTATACAAVGFAPRATHHADEWTTIFALVEAGLGITLVPRLVSARLTTLPPHHAEGVAIRPLAGTAPQRHIAAYLRRGSENAPHLAAVLDAFAAQATRIRTGRPMAAVSAGA